MRLSGWWRHRPKRTVAVAVAVALVVGAGAVAGIVPAVAGQSDHLRAQVDRSVPGRELAPRTTAKALQRSYKVPAPVWPAAGSAEVQLTENSSVPASGLPVRVSRAAARDAVPANPAVSRVGLTLADRPTTEASGVDGCGHCTGLANGRPGSGRTW